MKVLVPSRWSLGTLAACLAAAAFTGCSGSGEVKDDNGSGGSIAGSTGASGGGGQPGAGGTGAASATGGVTGSGGASSSGGGLPGAGGATGGGGSTGDGGSTGEGGGSTGSGANTCPPATPLTGGREYCSNSRGNAGNGYGYELWAEGGGKGCMTVHGVDAAFSAEWNNVEDFLARVGLDFNQTQKHTQIGTVSAEFAHTKTEEDGGLTYIGIYGWTVNPLREFYILDDWGSEKPAGFSSDGTPRDEVGTLTADGETYDVWKKTRVNKPAITGASATFDQYFSIRRTARTCGTISVSEHFTKWEALGLSLGNLHEIKLLVEAQNNSGTVKFTTAKFVVKK
ncbi:glycoside hydrolase family 11 protein [Sorangium sp. So ce124]|uniref:glycoside hydrolase family 11 protein n=2 Tax=unclassified Sorangium TaxID=2621164 RepID=UPI003F626698